MNDIAIIKTKTIGKDFAKTTPVLLESTPTTALVFYPEIHPGGVRGYIVRLKKNKNEEWEQIPERDFRKLNLYEGVKIELGTQQLEKLVNEVRKREELAKAGIQSGTTEFVIADKDKVIVLDNSNIKGVLEQVLERGYSDNFWNLVKASDPNLADKLSAGHLQVRRKEVIDELKERLKKQFSETKGPDSWQNWIYKNNWLFGANYQNPIERQKINIAGDLLPVTGSFELRVFPPSDLAYSDHHNPGFRWASEPRIQPTFLVLKSEPRATPPKAAPYQTIKIAGLSFYLVKNSSI